MGFLFCSNFSFFLSFVDQVFVIPDTDPTLYLEAMVSTNDIATGACCYVRGEDMVEFPARPFVEGCMPIFLLPRREGVSSTLLRSIYHHKEHDALFAATDSLGRPITSPAVSPTKSETGPKDSNDEEST